MPGLIQRPNTLRGLVMRNICLAVVLVSWPFSLVAQENDANAAPECPEPSAVYIQPSAQCPDPNSVTQTGGNALFQTFYQASETGCEPKEVFLSCQ